MVKLQNKEYRDWNKELTRRKNLKASLENFESGRGGFSSLGKRKNMEGIDVEKVLDVIKLRKIENKKMGFWGAHSLNLRRDDSMSANFGKLLDNGDSPNSDGSDLGLDQLLKIPDNWRSIVEEMGESEERLKKLIEVTEIMERWLKGRIKVEKGLFNFNPNAFEPEVIAP